MKTRTILSCFTLALILSALLASCATYYKTYAPVIGFDYYPFEKAGIYISPYDAPENGYKIIGDRAETYSSKDMLSYFGIKETSAEMLEQKDRYIEYITLKTIVKVKESGADAVFNFKVRPNTLDGAYGNSITQSYFVSYVVARKLNEDGSFASSICDLGNYDTQEPLQPTMQIDSTRCLAVIDGKQCQRKQTKRKPYCWEHGFYYKNGVFSMPEQ